MSTEITTTQVDRWTLYPIVHQDIWDAYKTHLAMFWIVDEVDMSRDRADFEDKLSPPAQNLIKNILAFFAFSDGMVMENCMTNFVEDIDIPEARQFYAMQALNEAIHAESYALSLQTLIIDETERRRLFRLVESSPSLRAKANFMIKYMQKDIPLATRLIAFSCVEGIFFSASFASIFWLKTQGNVMDGFVKLNEFISRDEGQHRDFAVLLYKKFGGVSHEQIVEIVSEACELEINFMNETLDVAVLGLDKQSMADYVRFVSDHLLVSLGLPKLYNVSNSLDYMNLISMPRKTNFFESRVTEYALSTGPKEFRLDEDF
jgi:ribonucleotide reductase beta subunit family protein with ferritin-like domain